MYKMFLLFISQLSIGIIVQNKNLVLSQPLSFNKHRNQRGVWDYLQRKGQAWKAEVKDLTGEFWNVVGPNDSEMFKSEEKVWVDPFASLEEKYFTNNQVRTETAQICSCSKTFKTTHTPTSNSIASTTPTLLMLKTTTAITPGAVIKNVITSAKTAISTVPSTPVSTEPPLSTSPSTIP